MNLNTTLWVSYVAKCVVVRQLWIRRSIKLLLTNWVTRLRRSPSSWDFVWCSKSLHINSIILCSTSIFITQFVNELKVYHDTTEAQFYAASTICIRRYGHTGQNQGFLRLKETSNGYGSTWIERDLVTRFACYHGDRRFELSRVVFTLLKAHL